MRACGATGTDSFRLRANRLFRGDFTNWTSALLLGAAKHSLELNHAQDQATVADSGTRAARAARGASDHAAASDAAGAHCDGPAARCLGRGTCRAGFHARPGLAAGRPVPVAVETGLPADRHHDRQAQLRRRHDRVRHRLRRHDRRHRLGTLGCTAADKPLPPPLDVDFVVAILKPLDRLWLRGDSVLIRRGASNRAVESLVHRPRPLYDSGGGFSIHEVVPFRHAAARFDPRLRIRFCCRLRRPCRTLQRSG